MAHGVMDIAQLVDKIRQYAREHDQSVLEVLAQHAPEDVSAEALVAATQRSAQQNQQSMLEWLADHALDYLPISIGRTIREYIEERKPKVKPGEVKYRVFFSSGRSDISERMEEIIYGSDPSEDE